MPKDLEKLSESSEVYSPESDSDAVIRETQEALEDLKQEIENND